MRLAAHHTRPHDAAPKGAWRRSAACLAIVALFAQLALSVHAFAASTGTGDAGDMCSVAPEAVPAGDGLGNAAGQPAAKHVHCPVCTAAPGAVAPPPPTVALIAPPPFLTAERPVVSFDVVQPFYRNGPPGHAPPLRT
ncbi:DUF2946 family protein [Azospirillum sp. sgz301742]